ncbi:uncharacterized protein BP01DRAFT_43466 [Aspergillus saccharolyticus JOP 1030-1]|uniref:Uncharacterized protein n=1 Tax=Aspergillus saccharolyticus JOP 1030-1 TaxID=1450539 RepID=A0A318ZZN0_9EURO|nr:hypothetical protein BP01DRAFT_43466 [Aspergillus saccharolyticus JOP 1030-1]PYH45538.1 hypothetical protein BP01DRAFT_43466 [Aspergillus saccharolyticus JOP 1030-1]
MMYVTCFNPSHPPCAKGVYNIFLFLCSFFLFGTGNELSDGTAPRMIFRVLVDIAFLRPTHHGCDVVPPWHLFAFGLSIRIDTFQHSRGRGFMLIVLFFGPPDSSSWRQLFFHGISVEDFLLIFLLLLFLPPPPLIELFTHARGFFHSPRLISIPAFTSTTILTFWNCICKSMERVFTTRCGVFPCGRLIDCLINGLAFLSMK